ncbi:MAG: hypothetical protein DYH18_02055 [Xanthomonadales bacterium PRO7]|jgi:uncharacterized delta-60 repeat protein|nr:hypothetical protein [Xanthomonadales bacterium PRO7]HMM56283.1 hypothetical protein [Rudaea sp.]
MSPRFSCACLAATLAFCAAARAADGDLDATFGSAGKVQLGPNTGFSGPVANDVAVQPDGKIVVVGYETNATDGLESWRIARLNANGTVDTSFASNGMLDWNAGTTGTRAHAVAVRPDGRIVVGGNFQSEIEVAQFTPNGSPDPTFAGGEGYILLTPPAGDSNYLSRLVLDTDGSIDIAGTYYANQSGFNSNEFFFDRIAANGSSDEPFRYSFGSGPNQDAHATDLAIDSQGRYVVVGYAPGANGYDCAVIRITRDLYDVDRTFHYQDPDNYGFTIMPFDLGGDDNDVCNAVAIFPGGYIAIGGHATANASNGSYQAAVLAELDNNGIPDQYYQDQIGYPAKFSFSYSLNPTSGQTNDITKLIVDGYDSKYAQLVAIGTGNQYAPPPGTYFGVARLNPAQSYSNFSLDTALNGKGVMGVYFAQRPTGLGNFITTNTGQSGTFVGGKLIAVGSTQATDGHTLAATRLATFDGIFKNGFETPSY